jgi:hypothetical protein
MIALVEPKRERNPTLKDDQNACGITLNTFCSISCQHTSTHHPPTLTHQHFQSSIPTPTSTHATHTLKYTHIHTDIHTHGKLYLVCLKRNTRTLTHKPNTHTLTHTHTKLYLVCLTRKVKKTAQVQQLSMRLCVWQNLGG